MAIGFEALINNNGGFADDNTAVGTEALHANTLGADNTAMGYVQILAHPIRYAW